MKLLRSNPVLPIAVAAVLLAACGPGAPRPVTDEEGDPMPHAISEKIFVEVNGAKQGMFITSTDAANPVLLFVHGGLGMPEFFLDEVHPSGLERVFTVCWWERRGAGLSYVRGMAADGITVGQWVDDTLAVTDYLAKRFGQDRIYLMGHSGGTFIAIQAAARAPQKYRAYIGVGQMSDQAESERRAYRFMLDAYRARGDARAIRRLERYPVLTADTDALLPYFFSMARDRSMHDLGVGTLRSMRSVVSGVLLPSLRSRAYSPREKLAIWRGKAFLQKQTGIAREMMGTDLSTIVTRLEIPAYFVSGSHDWTVARDLSKEYLVKIGAPVAGFYTFPESAHSPLFEEPERFLRVMTEDVLQGRADLADRE